MKNIILIDFSKQTNKYVQYAIDFLANIEGAELELVNMHNEEDGLVQLNSVKNDFPNSKIPLSVLHITGDITVSLPKHIKQDHIGFVFCGTHDIGFFDRLFMSETLDLFHQIDANFVFLPEDIEEFKPIEHALAPIMSDKHTVQELGPLLFLRHFMNFDLTLSTFSGDNEGQKSNTYVATKILNENSVPYSIKYLGESESELMNSLEDFAYGAEIGLISVVDFSEEHIFNYGERGFIEELIRNKHGIPVITIQNKNLEHYASFSTSGALS